MDSSSSIFDRIRIKPRTKAAEPEVVKTPCAHPGCAEPGEFRAPKGRDRENEYFTFCKAHVREYNATYDYFKGMDDLELTKFRSDEIVGHRPTWKMGQRAPGSKHVDESMFASARSMRRKGVKREAAPEAPRYNTLALKALATMELDGKATVNAIKARYKLLVKQHHPDANGGDRSSEEKLREIIQAYNFLRKNKLV